MEIPQAAEPAAGVRNQSFPGPSMAEAGWRRRVLKRQRPSAERSNRNTIVADLKLRIVRPHRHRRNAENDAAPESVGRIQVPLINMWAGIQRRQGDR
jgi:hypothetical protein